MEEKPEERETSQLAAIAVSLCLPAARAELLPLMQSGMSGAQLRPYLSSAKWSQAQEILQSCADLSIRVVPISSSGYPVLLRQIPIPPPVLFVRSHNEEWTLLQQSLAVVGTRAASVEACGFATKISMEISSAGLAVVSGLALGIDGAAHRGALASGRQGIGTDTPATVAVLAHGLDMLYPPSHEPLAGQILDSGGVLISEYAPGTTPLKHHFLARNRIIAGMSRGVVVIQAGSRSGSLVTARFAADFGRDVFVYQHSGRDERHSGGAEMIADGAIPFTSAAEILREYGLSAACDVHTAEELAVEEFLARQGISSADLLKLELEEKVERLPGNRLRLRC